MLLRASGIGKRFGLNEALCGVDFEVRESEVLGLIGPNGSGKTTLFDVLAGLLPADSGKVEFRGAALPVERRKQALFYIPDSIRPWPEQRVSEVLGFFENLYGKRAETDALQLSRLLSTRVGELSKGESKRLLLALGLITPQPILLLDEPFDGLDFRQTRDVMALLRTVPQQGRTLFLSIHQLVDAARVCDRLVLLSDGRIAGEGTLAELGKKTGLPGGGLEEIFLALT